MRLLELRNIQIADSTRGSAIMVVGAALQCSAFSLGHLIAGRVITGFGNGMNTSTVPTWASETSKVSSILKVFHSRN